MKRITLLIILSLCFVGCGTLAGYLISSKKLTKDLDKLNSSIESLFGDNNSVSDGEKFAFTGRFTDSQQMNFVFTSGGFTICELTKESNGFVKSITTSGNLKYKESETTWFPPQYITWPDGERSKIRDGYSMTNYRPSVQNCYDGSYEYLLNGNKDNPKYSYKPNAFTDLKNFPYGFSTNFYYIGNSIHPTEFYDSQTGGGQVYTNAYELSYKTVQYYYEVKLSDKVILKTRLIYIGVGVGIGLIITLIISLFIKKPKLKDQTKAALFDKKWMNIQDNTILIINSNAFGKFSVTLVKENKPITGKAIINNETIELKFQEFEYYFTISKVDENELILTDQISNKTIIYQKLGYNKIETNSENVSV